MVSITCWNCEAIRELSPFDDIDPLCSQACRDQFEDVVHHLVNGGTLADLAIDNNRLLGRRAIKVVLTMGRAERIEAREWREYEYERNRPRKLKSLYPC